MRAAGNFRALGSSTTTISSGGSFRWHVYQFATVAASVAGGSTHAAGVGRMRPQVVYLAGAIFAPRKSQKDRLIACVIALGSSRSRGVR